MVAAALRFLYKITLRRAWNDVDIPMPKRPLKLPIVLSPEEVVRLTFQICVDEMELGVGIHGEPGRRRVKMAGAYEITAELTSAILKDLSLQRGQQAILLVNGFGGTPTLELYVMVHAALKVPLRRFSAETSTSGPRVPEVGRGRHALCDAPGTYVTMRYKD